MPFPKKIAERRLVILGTLAFASICLRSYFFKRTVRNYSFIVPDQKTKRRPEKGGKLNTSQAGSVAASRAAVGQFLSISCEAFILRTGQGTLKYLWMIRRQIKMC